MRWQRRAEARAQIFIYLPVDFYPGLDFPDFQKDPLTGPWLLRSAIAQCPPLSLKSLCLGNASPALKAWGPSFISQAGGGVLSSPPSAHSQLHPCTEEGHTPKANLLLVSPGSNQLPESWLCRFQALARMTQVPDWLCCMPLGKLLLLS